MTEGQTKRQIKNIKKDMAFCEGGSNQIPLPTKYDINGAKIGLVDFFTKK